MSSVRKVSSVRPSLTPLLAMSALAWLATVLVEGVMWHFYVSKEALPWWVPVFIFGLACLMVLLLFLGRVRRKAAVFVAFFLVVIAAVLCSGLYWNAWALNLDTLTGAFSQGAVTIEITGDPAAAEHGTISMGEAKLSTRTVPLRIAWPDGTKPFSPGHLIEASGRLAVPGDDAAGRWNHQNGFVGTASLGKVRDLGLAADLRGFVAPFRDASFARLEALGGEPSGLLAGVLIGQGTLYSGSELEQDFKTTGLAHLMAVSGSHLVVIVLIFGWACKMLPLPRSCTRILLALLLVVYVALTCFSDSALRACVMSILGLGAGVFGRRRHTLSALCISAFIFILMCPSVVFSVGYQLSVLAVFGLILLSPLCSAWIARILPERVSGFSNAISETLTSSLTTLPLTVPLFSQLPLISPLANLVVGPLVTLLLAAGIPLLIICALAPGITSALLCPLYALASFCAWIVHSLADIPGACLPLSLDAFWLSVGFICLFLFLWIWWPEPRTETLSLSKRCVAFVFITVPIVFLLAIGLGGIQACSGPLVGLDTGGPQIIMLDVGQGDSMLIRDRGCCVLVDTGEEGGILKAALARHGVTHIDAIVLTHKDSDHTGALSALAGVVSVSHVYIHADLLTYSGETSVLKAASWVTGGKGAEGLRPGARLSIGELSLTLLAPESGGESENDDSLINLLEYDQNADGHIERRALLVGDAEEAPLASLCAQVGDIDILKVGHHGSRDAFTAEELGILKPELALISVGADNRYGHPTQETLSLLDAARAKTLRTDQHGDIAVDFSADAFTMRVQR